MRDGRRNGTYRVVLIILLLLLCNTGMAEGGGEAPMLQRILASDASRTSSARRRGVERIAIGGFPCSIHAS
ncbi:hypothetical protein B0H14DRAFT_2766784 [Mycena olivaceomarginata]|nr:hypothetical protein B0H14DRAFT_2766784 [Mycena olivaceomarginata]